MTADKATLRRAMVLRQKEALKLRVSGEIDFLEALTLVVDPPEELLEKSVKRAVLRPFAGTEPMWSPGDTCNKGHLRTEENTRLYRRNHTTRKPYLICKDCERLRWIEQMKDPEFREKRRAEKRARYAAAATSGPPRTPSPDRAEGSAMPSARPAGAKTRRVTAKG